MIYDSNDVCYNAVAPRCSHWFFNLLAMLNEDEMNNATGISLELKI